MKPTCDVGRTSAAKDLTNFDLDVASLDDTPNQRVRTTAEHQVRAADQTTGDRIERQLDLRHDPQPASQPERPGQNGLSGGDRSPDGPVRRGTGSQLVAGSADAARPRRLIVDEPGVHAVPDGRWLGSARRMSPYAPSEEALS